MDDSIIEFGEYTAERKEDHYTVRIRGMIIGHLELRDGMWIAQGAAISFGRPAEIVARAEPVQALWESYDAQVFERTCERLFIISVLASEIGVPPKRLRDRCR